MTFTKKGILIGIAGGSGSGKTLIAQKVSAELGSSKVIRICQDSYYRDLESLPFEERKQQNFDHPNAIDSDLLLSQIKALLSGKTISLPVYDFTTHTRSTETKLLGPHEIIVLDGILILDNKELRELMDIKIFVDTDPDIRLMRRLRRDILTRGRTMKTVLEQYEKSVRPMHLQFVEPSKMYADLIVPEGGRNLVAIDVISTKIQALIDQRC